jgi:hypothetical protein
LEGVQPEPARRLLVAGLGLFAAQAPARLGVPEPGQRVQDRIHIRADPQAEPGQVITDIGDNAQLAGGNGVAQGGGNPGAAEASGEQY